MQNEFNFQAVKEHYMNVVNVCEKILKELKHPEKYGCCITNCNTIVVNRERMMVVTVDDKHLTTYEFSPLYPTYFSPVAATQIVMNDVYRDINGNRIELEKMSKEEYYTLLKEQAEDFLSTLEDVRISNTITK